MAASKSPVLRNVKAPVVLMSLLGIVVILLHRFDIYLYTHPSIAYH